MAGGGNSPVVAIKLTGSTQMESWSEQKLLGGDVVLQVNVRSLQFFHQEFLFSQAAFPSWTGKRESLSKVPQAS